MSNEDAVFKALASPLRRQIMDALAQQPQTTGALCAKFVALDRCTVMQHLKVLEEAGLVVPARKGRVRWNHLDVLPIKRIHDRWIGPMAAHAAGVLDALEREVAEPTLTPSSP